MNIIQKYQNHLKENIDIRLLLVCFEDLYKLTEDLPQKQEFIKSVIALMNKLKTSDKDDVKENIYFLRVFLEYTLGSLKDKNLTVFLEWIGAKSLKDEQFQMDRNDQDRQDKEKFIGSVIKLMDSLVEIKENFKKKLEEASSLIKFFYCLWFPYLGSSERIEPMNWLVKVIEFFELKDTLQDKPDKNELIIFIKMMNILDKFFIDDKKNKYLLNGSGSLTNFVDLFFDCLTKITEENQKQNFINSIFKLMDKYEKLLKSDNINNFEEYLLCDFLFQFNKILNNSVIKIDIQIKAIDLFINIMNKIECIEEETIFKENIEKLTCLLLRLYNASIIELKNIDLLIKSLIELIQVIIDNTNLKNNLIYFDSCLFNIICILQSNNGKQRTTEKESVITLMTNLINKVVENTTDLSQKLKKISEAFDFFYEFYPTPGNENRNTTSKWFNDKYINWVSGCIDNNDNPVDPELSVFDSIVFYKNTFYQYTENCSTVSTMLSFFFDCCQYIKQNGANKFLFVNSIKKLIERFNEKSPENEKKILNKFLREFNFILQRINEFFPNDIAKNNQEGKKQKNFFTKSTIELINTIINKENLKNDIDENLKNLKEIFLYSRNVLIKEILSTQQKTEFLCYLNKLMFDINSNDDLPKLLEKHMYCLMYFSDLLDDPDKSKESLSKESSIHFKNYIKFIQNQKDNSCIELDILWRSLDSINLIRAQMINTGNDIETIEQLKENLLSFVFSKPKSKTKENFLKSFSLLIEETASEKNQCILIKILEIVVETYNFILESEDKTKKTDIYIYLLDLTVQLMTKLIKENKVVERNLCLSFFMYWSYSFRFKDDKFKTIQLSYENFIKKKLNNDTISVSGDDSWSIINALRKNVISKFFLAKKFQELFN
jgi:hypothetical protein